MPNLTDNRIKGEAHLRILLLTLKYIRRPEIVTKIRGIIEIFKEMEDASEAAAFLKSLLRYLESASPKHYPELMQIIREILMEDKEEKIPRMLREMFKEVFEYIEQEAEARGELKGEIKGEEKKAVEDTINMLKENIEIQTISRVTGKPLEKIQELQRVIQIVKNMQKENMDIQVISRVTGLTIQEIKELQ